MLKAACSMPVGIKQAKATSAPMQQAINAKGSLKSSPGQKSPDDTLLMLPSIKAATARPKMAAKMPIAMVRANFRMCSSQPTTSWFCVVLGSTVCGAGVVWVRSPWTKSSKEQSNSWQILINLSISGYARSASHLETAWRLTPRSMASCSWVMLRVERKCWRLSRKLMVINLSSLVIIRDHW